MITDNSTIINTDTSFFKIYNFDDNDLLSSCINEIDIKLKPISYRKVRFFSDIVKGVYYYGKMRVSDVQPLSPSLKTLLGIINSHFNTDYNGILINKYDNGSNYIQKHSDSKNHPENGVLIISYGSTRNFRIYDKEDNKLNDVPLIHGQMIHMGGDFQEEYEHDIEQDNSIKTSRYSLSFHKYMHLGRY